MTRLGPYTALGCSFEIEASPPIAPLLAEVLTDLQGDEPPCHQLRTIQDRQGLWSVRLDGERPFPGTTIHDALYNSLSAINSLAAREGANECAVLHGGSVTVGHRGVVFVGDSGAGKSTLTAAMVLAGHLYVADEVAAITSEVAVRSFHRPIGLRSGGVEALGLEMPPGPFERIFPLRIGERALLADRPPLAQIFIVERVTEASTKREEGVARLEPAAALFRLTHHALARGVERTTFRRIEAFIRGIPTFVLRYADVVDGVEMVEASMSLR